MLLTGTTKAGRGDKPSAISTAERDIVALGIAVAAVILFVGTGGSVLPRAVEAIITGHQQLDPLLSNALLLNMALIIFGWRRYRDLHREVRFRRVAEQQARDLAERDALTDCLNRRSGPDRMEAMRQALPPGRALAVLMIDLDNFKQINDINGHSMGDTVLVTLAARFAAELPDDSVIARIGGDEFACAFFFGSDKPEQVDRFCLKLIAAASRPVSQGDLTAETSVSIGIATGPGDTAEADGMDADRLIHHADLAMYKAKASGRNRHAWFEPQMEQQLHRRNELESAIRAGIAAQEFVPFYEPQVDIGTGKIVGFEMLARWQSERYGMVKPETFIPVAEEMDAIGELSEGLIRVALTDALEWNPSITLSVNISPVQLRDPWFAQKMLQLLTETGFPPARLELEITESCLHDNIAAVRSIVASLRNQGVRISLDDFGTGYASLSQLRSLPFDRLKIDRSFVADLARDGNGRELVQAIVSLGKGLSLPVTAEGVETNDILLYLQSLGDMNSQGYLYGQPEDAAATKAKLAEQGLLRDGEPAPVPRLKAG